MKTRNRSAIQGISFDPGLLAAAKERAREDGRSLSGYVSLLVRRDLRSTEQLAASPVTSASRTEEELA